MMFAVGAFFLLALSIAHREFGRSWEAPLFGGSLLPAKHRPLVSWLSALVPVLLSVCVFILIYRTMRAPGLVARRVAGRADRRLIWKRANRSLPGTWATLPATM